MYATGKSGGKHRGSDPTDCYPSAFQGIPLFLLIILHFVTIPPMFPTPELLDQSLLEMRWRCLSLAADLDRLERSGKSDPRLDKLLAGIAILVDHQPNRARRVQMLFSDQ